MKFDSNRAWQEAAAAVSASREVLAALSGVFFLLPSLAFGLFVIPPEVQPGAKPEAAMAVMQQFYLDALPWMLPTLLLQAAGTLAVLALLSDRARPTVGQAIRQGLSGLPTYIAAQLLFGMALAFALTGLVMVPAAAGLVAIAVLAGIAMAVFAVYALVKTSLLSPVIALEGERNPLRALIRSWQLTRGNSARILLFYVLLALVFGVVTGVGAGVVGAVVGLIGGAEAGRIAGTAVQSVLGSVMTLYFVAISAAIHRQLAGGTIPENAFD